ncbi:MAG: DNA double-strand break repair nuclease NurA [Chloroflexota bacterium]
MTLEINQLTPQINQMGKTIHNQRAEKQVRIAEAKALLNQYATEFDALEARISKAEVVQEAVRFSWLGAAPTDEPLNTYIDAPDGPEAVTIIASDGSQIYPDRHALTLYYLLNIGVIVYEQGGLEAPVVKSLPSLFYEEHDLFDDNHLLTSASVVNVKRDIGEIEILANLAQAYQPQQKPIITLIDGRLTLRTIDLSGRDQISYENQYLGYLSQLQQSEAIIAAYIDKPLSSFIISLIHLASLTVETISEETLRHNPFVTLADVDLFDDLGAGQRTALFNQRAKANINYNKAGHQIHFFYLNTGSAERPNLVRVEIPGWVAKNPTYLNTLHATLLRQTRITGGYPYVLARAHELAIIPPNEREALETKLAVSLTREGITPELSLKQHNKNLLSGREGFKV